jgi:hypothetical protein
MTVEELIEQSKRFETLASTFQGPGSKENFNNEITQLRKDYNAWYEECLSILQPELKKRFRLFYINSISHFLDTPLTYQGNSYGQSGYIAPFETSFRRPIVEYNGLANSDNR